MTGTSRYCFGDTVLGVKGLLDCTLSFRREGFTTRVRTEVVAGFVLHILEVTAPVRAARKERGL